MSTFRKSFLTILHFFNIFILVPLALLICILYTGNTWNGSETLHGLLAVDPDDADTKDLLKYIPDYRINLISIRAIENGWRDRLNSRE